MCTLTTTGPVTIEAPLVTTTLPLPDTTQADVTIQATLHNQERNPSPALCARSFGDVDG